MVFLDGTAVNVVLPVLARDLGAGFAGFQWVLNGYLVALAALVLPAGALGDRWGHRRAFITGAIAFAVASVACAAAPGLGTLIAARVLQGVAGALLVPSSLSLVQVEFHEDDRGQAVGLWSGLSGITTLIGPLLGGWLADDVSWRAVFVLNVPLAAITVVLARRAVPAEQPERAAGASGLDVGALDLPGASAAAAALGAAVFALTQGPVWGWSHPAVLGCAIGGAAAAVVFVLAERAASEPMLPPRFLRSRRFLGANLVTLGVYFVLSGVFFLLAIQLQRVVGYSALQAGAATVPITLLLLVLSPSAGRVAGKHGPEPLLAAGPLVTGGGVLLLARVGADAAYVSDVLPAVVVFGIGLSLTVAPVTSAALNALDEGHAGAAAGVNNAVSRTAQLLAVPLLPLVAGLSGIDRVGGALFSAGFRSACLWGAGVLATTAVASALVLGLKPGTAGYGKQSE
jgi:EmrB/QacA subfamily drug resistance transporter